ncbi:hypothetical protein GGR56DRAFT_666205 [Xylariaceae sp. FL0804]|nr:hypothetical protein GGR56DRAFT_666205 [Xylariaceae sp. FL0804]
MFGGLANLVQPSTLGPPPKDVPPPTPVRLPQCNPESASPDEPAQPSLVRFLQTLHRPTEVTESHFAALGVHVHTDVTPEDLIPDSSYVPSPSWEGVDLDESRRRDKTFRRPLSNGNLSPEGRVYLERRNELSIANQTAFRTVRRIRPEPGKQQPRLGNCYEFFKQLELMASFWDDSSLPPASDEGSSHGQKSEPPTLPPRPAAHPIDASLEQVGHAMITAAAESNARSEPDPKPEDGTPERVTYRTAPGNQMPPEFRHALVAAFVKLVTYDFGCNVAPPRVEPRLQLTEPSASGGAAPGTERSPAPRHSYFPSGCVFLFRTPTTREAVRAGIVEGPVAAVSARNTTSFATPTESRVDFGRELIAALVTAQHRAREGRAERRFGEGQWWATAKRWGGGEGGPIGREVEGDPVVGDPDVARPSSAGAAGAGPQEKGGRANVPIPVRGPPLNKKQRKNLSMYDSYRMVRLPSSNWDKKVRYEAIGRARASARDDDHDDVFVISSLFHHLCILRARVPRRLLEIADGAPEEEGAEEEGGYEEEGEGEKKEDEQQQRGTTARQRQNQKKKGKRRSWGKLEMWRTRWFDLFVAEERLEAMRALWGVMAWSMRAGDEEAGGGLGGSGGPGGVHGKAHQHGDAAMRDV